MKWPRHSWKRRSNGVGVASEAPSALQPFAALSGTTPSARIDGDWCCSSAAALVACGGTEEGPRAVVRLSPLHAMHRARRRRLALVRSGRPQPVCRGRLRVLRPGDGFASTFATADPHADAPPLGSLAASGFGRHPPATAHRLHGPSRLLVHGAARSCGLRRETAPSRRLRSPARAARYPWAVGSRARLVVRLTRGRVRVPMCFLRRTPPSGPSGVHGRPLAGGLQRNSSRRGGAHRDARRRDMAAPAARKRRPGCVGGGWRRSTLAASAAGAGCVRCEADGVRRLGPSTR